MDFNIILYVLLTLYPSSLRQRVIKYKQVVNTCKNIFNKVTVKLVYPNRLITPIPGPLEENWAAAKLKLFGSVCYRI